MSEVSHQDPFLMVARVELVWGQGFQPPSMFLESFKMFQSKIEVIRKLAIKLQNLEMQPVRSHVGSSHRSFSPG